MANNGYEIDSRPGELGGGVFPADPNSDPRSGMDWWNGLEENERRHWMKRAGDTGRAVDAWAKYLSDAAYDEAEAEGESWLASR